MALSGVHIAFRAPVQPPGTSEILPAGRVSVSQTMTSPGTAAIIAPNGGLLLTINCSAPIFYAVGPSPDPNGSARSYLDSASGREDVIASPGDAFAWVFA